MFRQTYKALKFTIKIERQTKRSPTTTCQMRGSNGQASVLSFLSVQDFLDAYQAGCVVHPGFSSKCSLFHISSQHSEIPPLPYAFHQIKYEAVFALKAFVVSDVGTGKIIILHRGECILKMLRAKRVFSWDTW